MPGYMDQGSHPDTSDHSSMKHMHSSVTMEGDLCPNQKSTSSRTLSFNSVGLMISSVLLRSADALNRSPV
ncbi:hypothetical protein TNCV_744601 [Trichonephila clavipes]|nr:hypothetical protein TNCV_744601 [Trichonephila clavipes]